MKSITLVIPVYNEANGILENLQTIQKTVLAIDNIQWQLLIVDDGSTDNTRQLVTELCNKNKRFHLISFSQNFGKEAAILAGLKHVNSDAVIVMDSDLQHPPALIAKMVRSWQGGMDVVEAYKLSRGKERLLDRCMSAGFYKTFALFSGLDLRNQTDFKLLDRLVVDAYCQLPERNRFFRGLIKWMNFPSAQIPFEVPERADGKSSWTMFSLFRLSFRSLVSFSSIPLYLIAILGALTLGMSIILGSIAIYHKITDVAVDGFTTVILLVLFMGSILMLSLGLIGVYVVKIYDEIKGRPSYFIDWQNSLLNHISINDESVSEYVSTKPSEDNGFESNDSDGISSDDKSPDKSIL